MTLAMATNLLGRTAQWDWGEEKKHQGTIVIVWGDERGYLFFGVEKDGDIHTKHASDITLVTEKPAVVAPVIPGFSRGCGVPGHTDECSCDHVRGFELKQCFIQHHAKDCECGGAGGSR